MTPNDIKQILPLPPNTPKRIRISLLFVQFLQHHNRLDGLMSFAAIWWASWTLAFPGFWYNWPVTEAINYQTFGNPSIISWALMFSGAVGYAGRFIKSEQFRSLGSLVGFVCWGVLTVSFLMVRPIFSPAVACYSLFAIAKLFSYVNNVIGIDSNVIIKCEH
ncbi:MAG: hypothetical protein ABIM73_06555 [Arenimonas sp.]